MYLPRRACVYRDSGANNGRLTRMHITDLACCVERHESASNDYFTEYSPFRSHSSLLCGDRHVHFVLKVSHQLQNSSSNFDLVGTSGQKLRTHITKMESEDHFSNCIRYVMLTLHAHSHPH